ncbi:hypothetical protein GAMM_10073 [Gammaproteobacteria bacterium]
MKKIGSFNVNSLNELRPLIDHVLGSNDTYLQEVKKLINQKLADIRTQITACVLVKEIIKSNGNVSINMKFNKIIDTIPVGVILNFTLADGRNVLMDFLCNKQCINHIVTLINKEDKFISSFVIYCLRDKKNDFNLVKEVIKLLPEHIQPIVINKIINHGLTVEHLRLAKSLVDSNEIQIEAKLKNVFNEFNNERIKLIDSPEYDKSLAKILVMLIGENNDQIIETGYSVVTNAAEHLLKNKNEDKISKLFSSIVDNKIVTANRLETLESIVLEVINFRSLDVLKRLLSTPNLGSSERYYICKKIYDVIYAKDGNKKWTSNQSIIKELNEVLKSDD